MPLGETLVSKGLVSQDQLAKALEDQKSSGDRLGDILVRLGFISREELEAAL